MLQKIHVVHRYLITRSDSFIIRKKAASWYNLNRFISAEAKDKASLFRFKSNWNTS